MITIEIETERLTIRTLTVTDVGDRYVDWLLDDNSSKYLTNRLAFDDLRKYVAEKTSDQNILFMGIFEKKTALHIGNIKYEPIDLEGGDAIMGILIGDCEWRGKGVAKEVIEATALWLNKNKNIERIILGVNVENEHAIRAYKKIGFKEQESDKIKHGNSNGITMVLEMG